MIKLKKENFKKNRVKEKNFAKLISICKGKILKNFVYKKKQLKIC